MIRTITFALLFLLDGTVLSQVGLGLTRYTLTGRVISSSDSKALFGVNVLVEGTLRGGITDTSGNFKIIEIPAGTYRVKVSLIGYRSVEDSVSFDTTKSAEKSLIVHKDFTMDEEKIVDPWLTKIPDSVRRGDSARYSPPCDLDSIGALRDIEKGTIHLVIDAGDLDSGISKEEKTAVKKYGIIYDVRYMMEEPSKSCLENYYKVVFPYLDRKFGNAWRNDLNKFWFHDLQK